jgi:hypothetical protein
LSLYEQICIAALDLAEDSIAEDCLLKLLKHFPNSSRVKRLQGMQLEYKG